MEDYVFQKVSLDELSYLRQMQTSDLSGQAFDPLEEHIQLGNPVCLKIISEEKDAGYALIDEKDEKGVILLEFYLIAAHRKNAKPVFNELVRTFSCSYWFVNSHDSFALPLMLDSGLPFELDGYIFSIDRLKYKNGKQGDEIDLKLANQDDLADTYNLIMQDGFYTGDGQEGLAAHIKNEEIYLLRSEGKLIGVGFVSPVARTPSYADIAMIIDSGHRRKGFATYLVSRLIQISLSKNLIPTALTSANNIASRKTLEKCGFYLDGCMLLAEISKR